MSRVTRVITGPTRPMGLIAPEPRNGFMTDADLEWLVPYGVTPDMVFADESPDWYITLEATCPL